MVESVAVSASNLNFWHCSQTWRASAINTMWCLIGCSIGNFGTIAYFQYFQIPWPTLAIMMLAISNGLTTSILLETFILFRAGMSFRLSLKTAAGMSLISIIGMESAMNITNWLLTGGALLTWWAIPLMLAAGFIAPWPYNYWRLKQWGKACH